MNSPIPQPGTVLAKKYLVTRKLGEGGMGVVLEAKNGVTGGRFAIKWMHPLWASKPQATERLIREAQAAAAVQHPNVVTMFDVVSDHGNLFLVMELLEGEPLSALLERGDTPLYRIIGLLLDAMRGVAAAHRAGVVHRDIKPDNIFLTRIPDTVEPKAKVLDFGIAKFTDELRSLTKTGMPMGTPMYMSYEQLEGRKSIDLRADIYAFGVILYQVVTGELPFQAETFSQLIIQVATTTPRSPRSVRPDIPVELERVIMQALAKKPEDRIPELSQLIQGLEPYAIASLESLGVRTTVRPVAQVLPDTTSDDILDAVRRLTKSERDPRNWPRALGMSLILSAILLGLWWLSSRYRAQEQAVTQGTEFGRPLRAVDVRTITDTAPMETRELAPLPGGEPSRPTRHRTLESASESTPSAPTAATTKPDDIPIVQRESVDEPTAPPSNAGRDRADPLPLRENSGMKPKARTDQFGLPLTPRPSATRRESVKAAYSHEFGF